MKWYKHDAAANMDAKLQEVLLDYGLEGYGLYWYCLELIAANVEPGKLTFELEHDARIIARNTGNSVEKVQRMMTRFVDLGLFENEDGRITCLKLAKRSDDYTAKLIRSQVIENKEVLESPTKSEKVPLEENRTDKKRIEKNKEKETEILEFLNTKAGKNFKPTESNRKLVRARIAQGYTVEDLRAVVDEKVSEWDKTEMAKYLRPSTLFNDEKFNQYFGELGAKKYEKRSNGGKSGIDFDDKTWAQGLIEEPF